MLMDAADTLKAQLRLDLKAAMSSRQTSETALLHTLIAALDKAEAQPLGEEHARYVPRDFGDPRVEATRRTLTLGLEEVNRVLPKEQGERVAAAEILAGAGRHEDARRLRADAEAIARYVSLPGGARPSDDG